MEKVLVIFGGRSAEHDVSIVTAIASIIKPLELTKKYQVEAVYVAKDGSWHWSDKLKDINLYRSGKIEAFLKKDQPAILQFDGGLVLSKPSGLAGRAQKVSVDVVFPAMHGTYGEDGALMGMLDMSGVPYVGCGVSASAIAMDKALAKQLAAANNVPVTDFLVYSRQDITQRMNGVVAEITKKLSFPVFVKPAHLGSSIGITRAVNATELQNGLEVAAHYDDKAIVEEAVQNLVEVTLPIMGNEILEPALLEQPLTAAEDFFNFETKYMQGGKKGKSGGKSAAAAKGAQGYSQIPAPLDTKLYERAEKVGLEVYEALGCSGIARVDMLIDTKTKSVYFNEVNPLPGGLYAHNWSKAGVSSVDLVDRLIRLAKERHEARQSLNTVFSTNYLQQF